MSMSTFFRLSAVAGLLSSLAIITDNLLPEGDAFNWVGVLSPVFGLLALTGLYLWQMEASGKLGALGYIANLLGMGFFVGLAFANAFMLPYLGGDVLKELFAGPTRLAFVAGGSIFLVGVILFGLAAIKARTYPILAALLYMVGFIPISLQPLFPPSIITLGSLMAGAGIAWFSYALWSGIKAGKSTTGNRAR